MDVSLFLVTLALYCLYTFSKGFINTNLLFRYPVCLCGFALIWLVPQGIELDRSTMDASSNDTFWAYAVTCFLATSLGFAYGERSGRHTRSWLRATSRVEANYNKLLWAALALGLFGVLNRMLVASQAPDIGAQWTGVITLYALFSGAMLGGLCLAALCYFKLRSRSAMLLTIGLGLIVALDVVRYARREALFSLMIVFAGSAFFGSGWRPKRVYLISAVVFGAIFVSQVGDLRQSLEKGRKSFASAMVDSARTYSIIPIVKGATLSTEVRQAKSDFQYVNRTGEFEMGAGYWNALVNQYFPAFLVGREEKNALFLPTLDRRLLVDNSMGLEYGPGLTRTGISDSFRNFWWLGSLVFALIGAIFGRLYCSALRGSVGAQYLYLLMFGAGLKSLTHSTAEFLPQVLFVVATYLFAFRVVGANPSQRVRPVGIEGRRT